MIDANRPRGAAAVEILERGEGHAFALHRNLFIAIWMTQGTGPLIERMDRISEPHAKLHPEGFSTVHFIGKGAPLATSEAVQRLAGVIRKHEKLLACAGVVLEGSGFWAGASRSLITGLRLVVPRTFELQVHSTVAEVAAWLPAPHAARTGVKLDPKQVERVLVEARAVLT